MFPLIFSSDERNYCLVLKEGTHVVGTLLLRKVPHGEFTLGLVGFVATAEHRRGLGVASRLLTELDRLALQEQIGAGLLWTSKHALYEKRGWRQQNLFPTQVLSPTGQERGLSVIPAPNGKILFQLAKQYGQFSWRTKRDFILLAGLSQHIHFGTIGSYLLKRGKQALGYAIVGNNRHVLEIVGERSEWSLCFNALGSFLNTKELISQANGRGWTEFLQEDRLTMVKVFNENFDRVRLKTVSLSPLDRI